jgi:DNA mismatch endonuclease (patch repair protein)
MADIMSKAQRSRLMSKIKGKNTLPELTLRQLIHAAGLRYRVHVKGLPGKPDIVFASRKKAIFVHGCFWHRHVDCKLAAVPQTNPDFWQTKFRQNVQRDRRNLDQLRNAGWGVLTVWECEMEQPAQVLRRVMRFLGK